RSSSRLWPTAGVALVLDREIGLRGSASRSLHVAETLAEIGVGHRFDVSESEVAGVALEFVALHVVEHLGVVLVRHHGVWYPSSFSSASEQADQRSGRHPMIANGDAHVGHRRVLTQVEWGVEREELKEVAVGIVAYRRLGAVVAPLAERVRPHRRASGIGSFVDGC